MNKMVIIYIILFLSVSLISQTDKDINRLLSGNWINSDFKDKLTSGFTPYESTSFQPTISALYFPTDRDSVQYIYNFHETKWFKYSYVDDKYIKIANDNNDKILIYKSGKNYFLKLVNWNDTVHFSFYQQTIPSLKVPSELINKTWLAGDYYLLGDESEVIIQTDGKISGFENYTHYTAAYDFQGPPDYDYIKFYSSNNLRNFDTYAWHFTNDTLLLNRVYIDDYFHFTKDPSPSKLIKIKSIDH